MLAFGLGLMLAEPAAAQGARLMRRPTVSQRLIAFEYGGDLWAVSRAGGRARRLTVTPSYDTDPHFSPDGSRIAFTRGRIDLVHPGNADVYLVPASGGEPRRLTWHPAIDRARGWSPDGRRVLFASSRDNLTPEIPSYARLWTIPVEGGLAESLPMPIAFHGAYAPDGDRIAYAKVALSIILSWDQTSQWRRYRGGRAQPIRIANLRDHSLSRVPWENSVDSDPMWVGSRIYFLSDRTGTVNLFAYDVETRQTTQLTRHTDFDVMSASAGRDAIVYEQGGYLHLYEIRSSRSRRLAIEVTDDLRWTRPRETDVSGMITSAVPSPEGRRAAVQARGEIFAVRAADGVAVNLTASSGAHDRDPAWSPDGNRIAWFSDGSGEYRLMLGDAAGRSDPRAFDLPTGVFPSAPVWSPDGARLLFQDRQLPFLWTMDLASGHATRIDRNTFEGELEASWSPDSRWVAYTRNLPNRLRAIFLHSLADGSTHRLTDGMADAVSPVFDASGKYLYFAATTEHASRPRDSGRWSLYLAVLPAGVPSPLAPGAAVSRASGPVRVDSRGLGERIVPLPLPDGSFGSLSAGAAGSLYYLERGSGGSGTVRRYRLGDSASTPIVEGVEAYGLSAGRGTLLYRDAGGRWGMVPADRPARPGEGVLDLARLRTRVDPRAEWAQIFREAWRLHRDFFYDSTMHAANWPAIHEKYRGLVSHVAHRADLSYLIAMLGAELVASHTFTFGGDLPGDRPTPVGLLGADYAVENGRYRIRGVYTGEAWNPDLEAPLRGPGIGVAAGDYLLEVNGRPLAPPDNVYRVFEGTAGRSTVIRVNRTPTAEGSRLVTVVPTANEDGLRRAAWVERSRRLVDSLSGGRVGYVWLPNTSQAGAASFDRYFYAQLDKEGLVIDDRFNQGGTIPDYLVEQLDRRLLGFSINRDTELGTSLPKGIFGAKVMVVNESSGSGGDVLPHFFRAAKLGPIVGTRTWGGMIGGSGTPSLIDDGVIRTPNLALYDPNGRWAPENEGIAPDVEVENEIAETLAGRDQQLERAVVEVLRLVGRRGAPRPARPRPRSSARSEPPR